MAKKVAHSSFSIFSYLNLNRPHRVRAEQCAEGGLKLQTEAGRMAKVDYLAGEE